MKFRRLSTVRIFSFLLITALSWTQSFAHADDSLTATLAASNSPEVRAQIQKAVGLSATGFRRGNRRLPMVRAIRTLKHAPSLPTQIPSNRSELRSQSFHNFLFILSGAAGLTMLIGASAVGLVAWFKSRAAKEKAKLEIIQAIHDRFKNYGIDAALELKWLNLERVARRLAKSEPVSEEKLDLLVSVIRHLRNQLQPNPGGSGYGKAIHFNRDFTYDIADLFEEVWKLHRKKQEFRILLHPIYGHGSVTYHPRIILSGPRSELRMQNEAPENSQQRTDAIKSLSAEVIRRLVNGKGGLLGIRIDFTQRTIETQLRERDDRGIPVAKDLIGLPDAWSGLFPEQLENEYLHVIDVIPSEDFPLNLISSELEPDYRHKFSKALESLLSQEGLLHLMNQLIHRPDKTYRLDEEERFEIRASRYPHGRGVFMDIFIHPPTDTILSSDLNLIAHEMLRRLSNQSSVSTLPNAVDLMLRNPRSRRNYLVSNYFQVNSADSGRTKERRERRLISSDEGAVDLVGPIHVSDENGSREVSLTYVGLHKPSDRINFEKALEERLDQELLEIFIRLKSDNYILEPGQTHFSIIQTDHFTVNVGRFKRDENIYFVNIYFKESRVERDGHSTPVALSKASPNIFDDLNFAYFLEKRRDREGFRDAVSQIYTSYQASQSTIDFRVHAVQLLVAFDRLVAILTSEEFGSKSDLGLAEKLVEEVRAIVRVSETLKIDISDKIPSLVRNISQLASGYLHMRNIPNARHMLTEAKDLYKKYRDQSNEAIGTVRSMYLLMHYSNLLGLYLHEISLNHDSVTNVNHARAVLKNMSYFVREINIALLFPDQFEKLKVYLPSLKRRIEEFRQIPSSSITRSQSRQLNVTNDLQVISDFTDKILNGSRSELRLVRAPSDLFGFLSILNLVGQKLTESSSALQLSKLISGGPSNLDSVGAIVVSRHLAFDKGLLAVFAALARNGMHVAIVAPLKEVDRQLVVQVNQTLLPEQRLIIGETLEDARNLLGKQAKNIRIGYVKGENEGWSESENNFLEVIELSDHAIEELKMSVRGLTELMNQAIQIYNELHRNT